VRPGHLPELLGARPLGLEGHRRKLLELRGGQDAPIPPGRAHRPPPPALDRSPRSWSPQRRASPRRSPPRSSPCPVLPRTQPAQQRYQDALAVDRVLVAVAVKGCGPGHQKPILSLAQVLSHFLGTAFAAQEVVGASRHPSVGLAGIALRLVSSRGFRVRDRRARGRDPRSQLPRGIHVYNRDGMTTATDPFDLYPKAGKQRREVP